MISPYRETCYGEEIKRIGVLADSHIPTRGRFLPRALFEAFDGAGLILHAGDLVNEEVLLELEALAPVEAVAGNMDPPGLRSSLGRFKLIRVGAVKIGLMHGDLSGHRFNYEKARGLFGSESPEAIVFGHLHRPIVEKIEGVLFFNPGSVTDPRQVPRPSVGLLKVDGEAIDGEIIYI